MSETNRDEQKVVSCVGEAERGAKRRVMINSVGAANGSRISSVQEAPSPKPLLVFSSTS